MSFHEPLPETPLPYEQAYSVRIWKMARLLVVHQDVINQHERGELILSFNGNIIKSQLDKLALNSDEELLSYEPTA